MLAGFVGGVNVGQAEEVVGGGAVEFAPGRRKNSTPGWQKYVDSRRLEITCGEAPFLASRYDAATGEPIPVGQRIGILDRKLRIVGENTATEADWLKWTFRALQSVYGYESQGDSLLLARTNLLLTFAEHLQTRWQRGPTTGELKKVANIIAWNLFQMDGLTCTVPGGTRFQREEQLNWFALMDGIEEPPPAVPCRVKDWRANKTQDVETIQEGSTSMKFDYVIGNPPYQEETDSDSTRMPPVYNHFMEESYKIAHKTEFITPSRFLFNAGYTPKQWNEKMLNDNHFKVLYYESNSSAVFPNIDIKGGVAITYRDDKKDFGAIGTFTKYPELNTILKKVKGVSKTYLDSIIASPLNYSLTELMKNEHPELIDRLRTSAFTALAPIFYEAMPKDAYSYIKLTGLLNGKRVERYIRADYIKDGMNILYKYNLLLPKAIGSGNFGEPLSAEVIAEPGTGYTQTFIEIGKFDTRNETFNASKYIKTKFARAMLGILKITQDCPAPKWKYVPLQDFTPNSDIDWSKSVADIDRQLYKKYDLSADEIGFIETHVKEMA